MLVEGDTLERWGLVRGRPSTGTGADVTFVITSLIRVAASEPRIAHPRKGRESIFIELVTSDRDLKASREGSK